MNSKQFLVRVQGGLCNRMRTLASAIGFAEVTGRQLKVCWEVTPYIQTFSLRDWRNLKNWRRFPAEHRFEASMKDLWTNSFDEISSGEWKRMYNTKLAVSSEFPPDLVSDAEVLMLDTCHDFFQGLGKPAIEFYKTLKLTKDLESRVRSEIIRFRPEVPTFGIHVRSFAAHTATTECSPLSWFVDRIGQIRSAMPDANIYLVTDSPSDSETLHKRFPRAFHEQARTGGYNTRSAIKKALVDVHVLAQTDYIIGSYFSSMSYLSATLQGGRGYEDAKRQWGEFPS